MASYHDELKALAESIGSDGCTHAAQVHVECCWEHDWSYVTGTTPRGVVVTKAEADQRFRDCLAAHSSLRGFSLWAWVRWTAVSLFGRGVWGKSRGRVVQQLMAEMPIVANAVGPLLEEARQAREAILDAIIQERTR